MSYSHAVRIKVPHQDLDAPSFFQPNREAVENWLGRLPRANLGETTRSLFQAITELNRVRLHPGKRMELLEPLRPSIYYAVRGLAKHYLNQPIILPNHARKVAKLAQTLFDQLAVGYTLVATHTAALGSRSGLPKPEHVAGQAVHRAITDYTQNLLRWYQLYRSPPDGFWRQLHQLYILGEQQGVTELLVTDKECGNCSLHESYLRVLLLGGARANQLRQADLVDVFNALTQWTRHVDTPPLQGNDSLLVVNTASDDGPIYRSVIPDEQDSGFSLDTTKLVYHLNSLRESAAVGALKVQDGDIAITSDLLSHLILAWSVATKRTFMRLESDERVAIAIGLSNTHHFISGGVRFDTLVNADASGLAMEEDNPFLRARPESHVRQKDVWDSPYQSNVGRASVMMESIDHHIKQHQLAGKEEKEKYRVHNVEMVNISPGGYCLKWPPNDPAQVKTGEIIGIRESHHKTWSIAVIRWVQQNDNGTQLGVELLSPTAVPFGARVLQQGGIRGEFQRVLVLPEIKQVGQPTTVLTPKLPFREQQKVGLMQHGRETKIQLTRKISSSGAYNQFEFRRLTGPSETRAGEKGAGFDNIWKKL